MSDKGKQSFTSFESVSKIITDSVNQLTQMQSIYKGMMKISEKRMLALENKFIAKYGDDFLAKTGMTIQEAKKVGKLTSTSETYIKEYLLAQQQLTEKASKTAARTSS